MHIGMMMRPPRASVSLIAQAIAILRRYGGSLWVADPAYVFTGSDGSGSASDGSDTGYVRDLCGNTRPLTQPTTSFKPKLKRVPKKLGPELVTNGNFAVNDSSWQLSAGVTIGSGVLAFATATQNQAYQANVITLGKQYQIQFDVAAVSAGSVRINCGRFGGSIGTPRSAVGTYSEVLLAAGTNQDIGIQAIPGGFTGSVDNVSVREVLEWSWALVFDGVDDLLQTASLPSVSAETLVVAKYQPALAVTAAVHKGTTNGGALLYTSSGNAIAARIGSGTAYAYMAIGAPVPATFVQSGVFSAGASKMRANGVQVATSAAVFASSANRLFVGSSASLFGQNTVFAAAYAPAAVPDAELLIVEKAMGQLGGITI